MHCRSEQGLARQPQNPSRGRVGLWQLKRRHAGRERAIHAEAKANEQTLREVDRRTSDGVPKTNDGAACRCMAWCVVLQLGERAPSAFEGTVRRRCQRFGVMRTVAQQSPHQHKAAAAPGGISRGRSLCARACVRTCVRGCVRVTSCTRCPQRTDAVIIIKQCCRLRSARPRVAMRRGVPGSSEPIGSDRQPSRPAASTTSCSGGAA